MNASQRKALFDKFSTDEDKMYVKKEDIDKFLNAFGVTGDKRKALHTAIMEWDPPDDVFSFSEFNMHWNGGKFRKSFDKFCTPEDKDQISKDNLFELLGECELTEENRKATYDEIMRVEPDEPLVHIDIVQSRV